jgi:integrase/recombinase XerD
MIEDMTVRNFVEKTRNDYIRHVKTFTAFLGRSPDQAIPEDLRCFQLHQRQSGVQPPSINGSVAALRFFFTVTLDRPEVACMSNAPWNCMFYSSVFTKAPTVIAFVRGTMN